MASADKGLEEWLKEVGDRLTSPPADVEELVALLDQTESLLLRIEQSPPQSISNAIRPAMTALVARGFLEHSDLDVKAGLASCISEITRITAPDAPYDDNLMKEIFERFVETFEHLDDVSSRSFSKKVAVLETLAKVRSCVVMLDLECDALILKMFQHFFKTIRPGNASIVFSPMETIMVLVLEESEDISPELISCLLESVKIDNKDILPVARELGEKVISSCAAKIKPYLSELFQSLNLQSYSSVVASICQDAPDVLEQNNMAAPGDIMDDDKKQQYEQTVSNELYKGSGKVEQEVDCAEAAIAERTPEQSMNNDGSALHDNSALEPSSPKQKSKRPRHGGTPRKTAAVGKKDLNNLEPVGEDPNSTSVPVAKKLKGMSVNSLCSLNKEDDGLSIFDGTPANDVEACSGKTLKGPVVADNGTCKVPLSTEVSTPDTIQRKRGRPNSKLSSKKGGGSGANKSSTLEKGTEMNDKASSSINNSKEHDSAVDLEQKPSVPDVEMEPKSVIAAAEAPSDVTSLSENKTSKQSSKRASISKASQVMSLQKQKSTAKQHDKLKTEDKNGEPCLTEIMSSGKKAHKTRGTPEEKVKSSNKHARGVEKSPKTPAQHEGLDGSLVGSRIKVWWPDDEQYYEGTVETYDPSSKKHKILYDDGDIEILLLKKERWALLDKDHKNVEGQVKDNSFPDASSEEPQSKKTKKSSSSVSKERYRGTESNPPKRKGRPPKDISLAEEKPNDSRKVLGKSATKKDAGAKSDLAEDIPSESDKAIGKSHSKKDAGTKSSLAEDIPSDTIKAVGKFHSKKDAGTKFSLAADISIDSIKAVGKSNIAEDIPSDSDKAIGKSHSKMDAGTNSSLAEDTPSDLIKAVGKSNVAEDSPSDSNKATEKSASQKEVGTKSTEDIPSVLSKATGRSTSKKEAGTKSSLGEDTPSDPSKATRKSACKKEAGTKSASKKEAGTTSNLAEDIPSDSSKATGKFASEKESGTKSNLAEDNPSDSSKATGKSASKKDARTKSSSKKEAGTKSNLAEDIPCNSSKTVGKSASEKESGTKSNIAEDNPSDLSKATGKSASKKDASTKSSSKKEAGTKSNLAEDIPSNSSKTAGKSASDNDASTNSTLAEDMANDSSKAIGKPSKKDVDTKCSISQDVHSDSSKAMGKSATKKVAGTKSRLAEDSPSDSGKVSSNSAQKDVSTKCDLAEDGLCDSGKAIGKSGTKKDAPTKSKTGIVL